MRSGLPKIVKDAQRLRAAIEEAFTRMARRHKYASGADLRAAAKTVVQLALRAWREPELRLEHATAMSRQVDELKLELQLAKDVNAFRSFGEFEAIVRLATDVSAQSGGWLRVLRSKGQNAQGSLPVEQRAQTLSSRSALGATP